MNSHHTPTQENYDAVVLYVESQGDKFHPLSDSLLTLFPTVENEPVKAQVTAVEQVLAEYEANPESKYHQYHVDRMKDKLTADFT